MDQPPNERERLFEQSKGFVGGLLGFCSAAVLALVVVEAHSALLTIALWCFALTLPVLIVQFMDFYRPDRDIYNMGTRVANLFGAIMMFVPFVGMCAVLAHVSSVLCAIFALWSVVCMVLYGMPFNEADRDKEARARHKSQPAKTLYVTDPDAER